jgi:DNA mismatch endonuclease (patch repair protein)
MSGLRLRHQPVGIPGSPDFANKSGRIAVFINGCFWHGCPKHFKTPKTRRKFWADKIRDNKARDRRANRKLRGDGWHVIRVWEHELD